MPACSYWLQATGVLSTYLRRLGRSPLLFASGTGLFSSIAGSQSLASEPMICSLS